MIFVANSGYTVTDKCGLNIGWKKSRASQFNVAHVTVHSPSPSVTYIRHSVLLNCTWMYHSSVLQVLGSDTTIEVNLPVTFDADTQQLIITVIMCTRVVIDSRQWCRTDQRFLCNIHTTARHYRSNVHEGRHRQ